tara:strand:+ start:412 stop:957 length:546 start_codon:yes stop_codon:yes gene_type:complete
MASKIKVDQLETADGTGTIALQNQLSGMTTASLPALGSAQMPTGSVLQVVSVSSVTVISSSSSSWFDIGLSLSITPSSTSNKILLQFSVPAHQPTAGNHQNITLFRGTHTGTNLGDGSHGFGANFSGSGNQVIIMSGNFLDSPSTTSAQTYTVAGRNNSGNSSTFIVDSAKGTLTAMEIAG